MKSHEFCYWLQGYFELRQNKDAALEPQQVEMIQRHLNMVFVHEIDPKYPVEQQADLNKAHGSGNAKIQKPNYGNAGDFVMRC